MKTRTQLLVVGGYLLLLSAYTLWSSASVNGTVATKEAELERIRTTYQSKVAVLQDKLRAAERNVDALRADFLAAAAEHPEAAPPRPQATPCPTLPPNAGNVPDKESNAGHPAASTGADTSSSSSSARYWLVVGIPTVPRKDGSGAPIDYLTPTLESWDKALPKEKGDLFYGRVLVMVINNKPQLQHPVFDTLAAKYADNPHFRFDRNDGSVPDPAGESTTDVGNQNKPGYRVRRQTRDVIYMLRKSAPLAENFLFSEDDFLLCANGLHALNYMMRKATAYHGEWSAIRTSFGLTGIIVRNARDHVNVIANYLEKRQFARPPDHILVEWYARETPASREYFGDNRRNVAFRYNVLDHIGRVSSLRSSLSPEYPRCYDELLEPINFKVEAFDKTQCPNDDLWPCNTPAATAAQQHTAGARLLMAGFSAGKLPRAQQ